MKALTILLLLATFALTGQAQFSMTGFVRDADTYASIENASVYLNETSIGMAASFGGKFELTNIPAGRYQLVASSVGYDTYSASVVVRNDTAGFLILMRKRREQLDSVTVLPYLKDGWEKWGSYFIENFIGKTDNAFYCSIKNKEVLQFRYSEKNNVLHVSANEPLIIENKALGYTIQYNLKRFTAEFNRELVKFAGTAFFEEMRSESLSRMDKWKQRREEAYRGSLMHFMRAAYADSLSKAGFSVTLVKSVSKRKDTYLPQTSSSGFVSGTGDVVGKIFEPDGRLRIRYNKRESEISMLNKIPLALDWRGSVDVPDAMLLKGHWSHYEKMSNGLPFDYGIRN